MNGLTMLGAWATAAAVIALFAGWAEVNAWITANQALAAWVQAIGAILAILATGWAVNRSHTLTADKARAEAKAEEIRKLASIASCIFHCRAHVESLRRYNAYTVNLDRLMETLTRQVNLLRSIGLLDIPDWRASVAVAQTIGVYAQLEAKLRNETIIPYSQHIRDERDAECRRVITRLREFERMVQNTLLKRGADVPPQEVDYADGTVASLSIPSGDRTFVAAGKTTRDDLTGFEVAPATAQQ